MEENINNNLNIFTRKKLLYIGLLLVLLLPTFFINRSADTDWGDDYIQYIYQSKHLFEKNTNYKTVINPQEHAPPKRGLLFSLFLSLNQDIHKVLAYKNLMWVTYVLAALMVFMFFSSYVSNQVSLLLVLACFYNYRNLWLKNDIAAEYAMMALLYFILYLSSQKKIIPPLILGLLFAALLSIRMAGLVFLVAYVLQFVFNTQADEKIKHLVKLAVWCFMFVFAFDSMLQVDSGHTESNFYSKAFVSNFNFSLLSANLHTYAQAFPNYFVQELPFWLNVVLIYPALIFIVWGFLHRLTRQAEAFDLACLIYLITLLIWDNSATPIRYLIPILPLVFFYLIIGFKTFLDKIKINSQAISKWSMVYAFVLLVSNVNTILLFKKESKLATGPLSVMVQNDFESIQKMVPQEAIIAFYKPLVINLCCNRNSFALKETTLQKAQNKADYFLIARNPLLREIYEAGKNTKITQADTIYLEHFWLLKRKP